MTGYLEVVAATGRSMESVYRTEYEPMVRLAYVMLRSQESAEDVVHEAFAKLAERWEHVRDPGAYTRQAVVNGCRNAVRRRDVQRRHLIGARESAARDSEVGGLDSVLARLRPRARAVVVLRYYLDYSEAEIASTLRMRPGTVKSTLSRALAALRIELRSYDDGS